MIIAIVDFETAPETQAKALDILLTDVASATNITGNLGFRAFSNAQSDTHVGLMHEWETLADFEAYTASDAFKQIGAQLRPMMTAAPVSRRFEAQPLEQTA